MYVLLYAIALGCSSSPVLPPPAPLPLWPGFALTPCPPLQLAGLAFVGATGAVAVTVGEAEVSYGGHRIVWLGPWVGRELILPP